MPGRFRSRGLRSLAVIVSACAPSAHVCLGGRRLTGRRPAWDRRRGRSKPARFRACHRIRRSRRQRGSAKECGASPGQDHRRPCRVSRQEAVGARKGPREVRVLRGPQGPCNRPPPWYRSTMRRSYERQAGSLWRSRGLEFSLLRRGGHPTRDEHQFCICSVLQQSSQMDSYQSLFRRKGFRA